MSEPFETIPADHDDYVSALQVIAEASENVALDLEQLTVNEAEQITFVEVVPVVQAESMRRLNFGMGKVVGGAALGALGLTLNTIAQVKHGDHKGLLIAGTITAGIGALAALKGGKQVLNEISWAFAKAED